MPDLTSKLSKESGIDQNTLTAIRELQKIYFFSDLNANENNKKNVQHLLVTLIGNMDINKKLSSPAFKRVEHRNNISFYLIEELRAISFKTRHLHKIEPEMDKIWSNFSNFIEHKHSKLKYNQKISIKQYALLHDLAALYKMLGILKQKNLITGNAQLEKIFNYSEQASKIIEYTESLFAANYKMPHGATFFYKIKAFTQQISFFHFLMTFFITRFFHASIAKKSNFNQGIEIAHLTRDKNYTTDKHVFTHFLYNDGYKINLSNLITDNNKKVLQQHFGESWQDIIEQKYAAIERKIHDHTYSTRTNIILDFSTWRYTLLATTWLQGGHKNFFVKDHNNAAIRNEVYGASKWNKEANKAPSRILCSEFVGRTLIATIQELNDELTEALKNKGVKNIPHPLVKSPLSNKEKLYLLTPERLLKALQERGAVKPIKAPKEIRQFINIKKKTKQDKSTETKNTTPLPPRRH